MSVVSLVRWGVRNPRPEQRVSKNLSFEAGFDQISGDNVLPFPDRTAFRIPPGGIPRPDDPADEAASQFQHRGSLTGQKGRPRSSLRAVCLVVLAATFAGIMIGNAFANEADRSLAGPSFDPYLGQSVVRQSADGQSSVNLIWVFVPARTSHLPSADGRNGLPDNFEVNAESAPVDRPQDTAMPSYYGPLPDWETGPLASNDVLDADKNGSVTAEIADTTTAAPSAVPAPDDLSNSVGGGKVLAPHLKQKILLDPKVEEARARVCQMVHRLGLAKAGARPQLSANVSGSRQIVGRIKRDPGAGNFFRRTTPQQKEIALTKSPEAPVVTAGMPLQVDILGGKRTIMEYIMTPLEKSLSTAFREN